MSIFSQKIHRSLCTRLHISKSTDLLPLHINRPSTTFPLSLQLIPELNSTVRSVNDQLSPYRLLICASTTTTCARKPIYLCGSPNVYVSFSPVVHRYLNSFRYSVIWRGLEVIRTFSKFSRNACKINKFK